MNRFAIVAIVFASVVPNACAQDKAALATEARKVFKNHCQRCHNGPGSEGGNFDVMNEKTLLASGDGEGPVVVAGKPDESKLWQRAGVRRNMPPRAITTRP